jgi:hypothetical protein
MPPLPTLNSAKTTSSAPIPEVIEMARDTRKRESGRKRTGSITASNTTQNSCGELRRLAQHFGKAKALASRTHFERIVACWRSNAFRTHTDETTSSCSSSPEFDCSRASRSCSRTVPTSCRNTVTHSRNGISCAMVVRRAGGRLIYNGASMSSAIASPSCMSVSIARAPIGVLPSANSNPITYDAVPTALARLA